MFLLGQHFMGTTNRREEMWFQEMSQCPISDSEKIGSTIGLPTHLFRERHPCFKHLRLHLMTTWISARIAVETRMATHTRQRCDRGGSEAFNRFDTDGSICRQRYFLAGFVTSQLILSEKFDSIALWLRCTARIDFALAANPSKKTLKPNTQKVSSSLIIGLLQTSSIPTGRLSRSVEPC